MSDDKRAEIVLFVRNLVFVVVNLLFSIHFVFRFYLGRRDAKYGHNTTAIVRQKYMMQNKHSLHYEYRLDHSTFVWNQFLNQLSSEIAMSLPEDLRGVVIGYLGNENMIFHSIEIRKKVNQDVFDSVKEEDPIRIRVDPKYVFSTRILHDDPKLDSTQSVCNQFHVQPLFRKCPSSWSMLAVPFWIFVVGLSIVYIARLLMTDIMSFILERNNGVVPDLLVEILVMMAMVIWVGVITWLLLQTQLDGVSWCKRWRSGTISDLQIIATDGDGKETVISIDDVNEEEIVSGGNGDGERPSYFLCSLHSE